MGHGTHGCIGTVWHKSCTDSSPAAVCDTRDGLTSRGNADAARPTVRDFVTQAMAGELAALNQQKVAIQREFEAFKVRRRSNLRAARKDLWAS